MNQGLFFQIQTLKVKNGKELKEAVPDTEGFYTQPLMVLGKPSRNNARYEDTSVVAAITNPQGRFYKLLTEGCLEGEYSHPYTAGLGRQEQVNRAMLIHKPNVSHYFKSIYTKKTEQGNTLIMCKVKPTGPYGKYLEESLKDPDFNTGWSLRSLCSKPRLVDGIQHKKILMLVTFDAVGGPGFEEASKRYSANECIEIPVDVEQLTGMDEFSEFIGVESFQDEQLFDMLGTDKITLNSKVIAWPDINNKQLITPTSKLSIFHTLHQGR